MLYYIYYIFSLICENLSEVFLDIYLIYICICINNIYYLLLYLLIKREFYSFSLIGVNDLIDSS